MEKADAHCVRVGLKADCNKEETGLADCVLSADADNLETVRGAVRAKDLMEIILRELKRSEKC